MLSVFLKSANTIFYCNRWAETVAFYRDGLGLPVCFSNHWFVEFVLTSTARLSIADQRQATVHSAGGRGSTLSLEVDDIRAVRTGLRQSGLNPGEIRSHAWNAEVFYLFDPEGHRLEIWQPRAKAV